MNGFTLFHPVGPGGRWVIKCDGCGQTATYSTEGRALAEMGKRHCAEPIPFDGEPIPVDDDSNGLVAGVDY